MAVTDSEMLIFEYWDVPEENEAAWLDYNQKYLHDAHMEMPVYAGTVIMKRASTSPRGTGPRQALQPHPMMRTAGIRTDRSINFDALFGNEYSIVLINFFRDKEILKAELGLFRQWSAIWDSMRPGWSEQHGTDDRQEAISREYFGLVNNHWDAVYDTVISRTNDSEADDEPQLLIFEWWKVPEENRARWLDYYDNFYAGGLRGVPGYTASMVLKRSAYWPSSGSRRVIQYHASVRTGGVRTDRSINLDSLLMNEYDFAAVHFFSDKEIVKDGKLASAWMKNWETLRTNWHDDHPGVDDATEAVSREFFGLANNHWDASFEVIYFGAND